MKASYSTLGVYHTCPRLSGFTSLGWRKPGVSEPMTTGTFFHAGISAYFKGDDPHEAATNLCMQLTDQYSTDDEEVAEVMKAFKRYKPMLDRYINNYARAYVAIATELEIWIGETVCHIDLVAIKDKQLAIVDYKTGRQPDARWFDLSGQADLYAYMYELTTGRTPATIIYDCISDEGIFRHQRTPNFPKGQRIHKELQALSTCSSEGLLAYPYPQFDCPRRCDFFMPCWLLETGTMADAMDFLKENFIKEVR